MGLQRGQGGWQEGQRPAPSKHWGPRDGDPPASALRPSLDEPQPQPRGTRLSEPLTPPSTSARAALASLDPHGPVPVAAAVPQAPQNPPAPAKTFPINPQLRRGLRRHTLPAPATPPARDVTAPLARSPQLCSTLGF